MKKMQREQQELDYIASTKIKNDAEAPMKKKSIRRYKPPPGRPKSPGGSPPGRSKSPSSRARSRSPRRSKSPPRGAEEELESICFVPFIEERLMNGDDPLLILVDVLKEELGQETEAEYKILDLARGVATGHSRGGGTEVETKPG